MLGRNQTCGMTVMERFESYVMPEPNMGCWLWLGTIVGRSHKYPMFWNGTKVVKAHRWIYEQIKEKIPAGLVLDHKCRVTSCVNPEHLRCVTQRENVLCGEAPAALQAKRIACIHGHLFDSANTYFHPNGRRSCKTCRRAVDRNRRGRGLRRLSLTI